MDAVVDCAGQTTRAVNQADMSVSIDNLGENVTTPAEASQAAALYRELLAQISARGLNANVSVKLTHMGLDVNQLANMMQTPSAERGHFQAPRRNVDKMKEKRKRKDARKARKKARKRR